ncbi:RNA polymerase sigma factor [Roseimaritima ulvae]|uniref:ECF RNA polymerase sigma-E factor n=1 Tax=Roseimaritima ulvae TaxID=980254 RepID=A0A5B9QLG2_9BACT|nr:RNA polymerase sigma factor [Roseimaritima ulvae]QEG38365.1 ECF RNA polymerase sigma-E factor [Roseimaritima ulvae]
MGETPSGMEHAVQLAMTGDQQACQLLVQRWYRCVYAYCQARLLLVTDAEDATQETFVRGLKRLHELRSPDALGAWLRGIAHHVCVDTIRRHKTRRESLADVDRLPTTHGHSAAESQVDRRDRDDHLLCLIYQLPEELRESIFLHYYDCLTYDQMAAWLGVARSTVNERLGKARNQLKLALLDSERGRYEL